MLFLSNIYGCSEQLLGLLKSNVVSGSIEAYNNENQPKVIVVEGTEKNIYRVGDEIVFTQQLTKDMQSVLSFDTYRFDIKTTVGAIVRISQDDTQLSSFLSNKPIAFLVHDSVLDIEGLTLNYSTLWLTLADENSYTKTEELLRIIKDAYPESNIISQRQTANSHRLLVSTFRTVIVSLICVLFVFSLFSLNNTLQQKLNEQKRLWGMLRALGLACKHAVLYQSVEIIILNIFAWLVGCGFSAIFIIFLVGTNAKPWFEIFPWTVSLIILISNLLFCILISAVSIRRLYKYNISETIQSLD